MGISIVYLDHRVRILLKPELLVLIFLCLIFLSCPVRADEPPISAASWPAEEVSLECDVTPLELVIGPTQISQTETHYFRVVNHGDETLTIDPVTDNSAFTVEPGPIVILPGEAVYPWVTFEAAVGDTFYAEVSLGPAICSSVSCVGIVANSSGIVEDLIGITFDPESLAFDDFDLFIETRPGILTGYLALLNPSSSEPLGGWECCVQMEGDAFFINWQINGSYYNIITEPCFMVVMSEPIPPAPYYVLAEVTILVNTLQEDVIVSLHPVQFGSIPDEMAWRTDGEDAQLIPMHTPHGYPEVAQIRIDPAADVPGPLPEGSTRLLANIPNPFNPRTAIHFELEKAAPATVKVFDVTGRLVATLVNESLDQGLHSCAWNGRDSQGRRMPSGAYYIRLESAGRLDRRKVLLLK